MIKAPKIFLIFFLLSSLFSIFPTSTFANGCFIDGQSAPDFGEPESPFLLDSVDDVNAFADSTCSNSLYHFKLTSDIDFTNEPFIPADSFNGVFDGDGHTISNISIAATIGSSNTNIGFVRTNNGTIKNLRIDNFTFTSTNDSVITNLGAIAGTNSGSNAKIINIQATGTMTIGYSSSFLGGLVGLNTNNANISRSSANVNINGNGLGYGGLVGKVDNGLIELSSAFGRIQNSFNTGSSGGFVGQSFGGMIKDSYAYNESNSAINTGNAANPDAGAFVGFTSGSPTFTNVYAFNNIQKFSGNNLGSATVTNSYFNSGVDDDGTFGRSAENLRLQSTFNGWNFALTWELDDSINDGYPHLKWESFNNEEVIDDLAVKLVGSHPTITADTLLGANGYFALPGDSGFAPDLGTTELESLPSEAIGGEGDLPRFVDSNVNLLTNDGPHYYSIYAYLFIDGVYYVSQTPRNIIVEAGDQFVLSEGDYPSETDKVHLVFRGEEASISFNPNELAGVQSGIFDVEQILDYPTLISRQELLRSVQPYQYSITVPSEVADYNGAFEFFNHSQQLDDEFVLLTPDEDNLADWDYEGVFFPIDADGYVLIDGFGGPINIAGGLAINDFDKDPIQVTSGTSTDEGTIYDALTQAEDGDIIEFDLGAIGSNEVSLSEPLTIQDNVIIRGNGVTLNFADAESVASESIYHGVINIQTDKYVRIEDVSIINAPSRALVYQTDVTTYPVIQTRGYLSLVNSVIANSRTENGAPSIIGAGEFGVANIGAPVKTVLFNTTLKGAGSSAIFSEGFGVGAGTNVELYNSILDGTLNQNIGIDIAKSNLFRSASSDVTIQDSVENTFNARPVYEATGATPHRTTNTYAPAINSGLNSFAASEVDQLQTNRILGLAIDIGPYERESVTTVPGGGGTTPPVGPTIPADGGADGTPSVQIPIDRVANGDGTFRDTVNMTTNQATELIQRLREANRTTVRIVLPDADDVISEARVNIPRGVLQLLADAGLSIEIATRDGRVTIPNASANDFDEDLFFLFRPVKSEEGQLLVENRAKSDSLVVDTISSPETLFVVGRPMTIETNMQERLVELEFPVPSEDVPDGTTRQLKMFIEHSDGTKELKDVEVIQRDGQTFIRFTTNKFSTFTVLNVEVAEDPVDPVDPEEPSFHEAYIRGFEDGTFRPSANVSRAQVAVMIARNLGFDDTTGASSFSDVPATHWASGSIAFVREQGIFGGYSDGTFRPNDSITRGEIAAVVARYKDVSGGAPSFLDARGHWAAGDIAAIESLGIIEGYPGGEFRPRANVNRAEAVKMLNRTFDRGPLFGVTTPSWPDVPLTHWAFTEIEEASRDHSFLPRDGGGESLVVE